MTWKFFNCKFHINKKVVPIKVFFFTLNLGSLITFPFLTLQMRSFGLTFEDIGYIYGLLPIFIIIANPVSGFIGDRIGYRAVMFCYLICAAVIGLCYDFTPRYEEVVQIPVASIKKSANDPSAFQIDFVQWPLCSQDVTAELCQSSKPLQDNFQNLTHFISCPSISSSSIEADFVLDRANVSDTANGTFCIAHNTASQVEGDGEVCEIHDYPDLDNKCVITSGSHSATFWVYYALRVAYGWTLNSVFSLGDAAAVQLAKEHNSDYSFILFFGQLGVMVAPFVSGLTIQDNDGTEDVNLKFAFYAYAVLITLSAFISLTLKVKIEKSGESVVDSLKKIVSKPSLNFLAMVYFCGFQTGIHDVYLFVYLKEDLGASSQLLSYYFAIGAISGIIIIPFGKKLVDLIGDLNLLSISIWTEGSRLLIFSLVKSSPPYYGLGLQVLDSIVYTLSRLCLMHYSFKIAPTAYVGTMVSVVSSVEYMLGKGSASIISGQILTRTSWDIPELFQFTSGLCGFSTLALFTLYYLAIKSKSEKRLLEEKEKTKIESNDRKMTVFGSLRKNDTFVQMMDYDDYAVTRF